MVTLRWAIGLWSLVCGAAVALGLFPATAGTLTTTYAIPRVYTGVSPDAALTVLDGKLYGTTFKGGGPSTSDAAGTVFSIDIATGRLTTLTTFDDVDGNAYPSGLLAWRGKLYGTAAGDSVKGPHVVFSIDPATGAEDIIATLPDGTGMTTNMVELGGLLYVAGDLCSSYGTDLGCIFSVDPVAKTAQVVKLFEAKQRLGGDAPQALVSYDGAIYGVTRNGGEDNLGALFKFDPGTKRLSTLLTIDAGTIGEYPVTLIGAGGMFYGTTSTGGAGQQGTVFSFDLSTQQGAVLHSFSGGDGALPYGGLLLFDGLLYGTTYAGGVGRGVVFSLDPSSRQETTLHSFTGVETGGVGPQTSLVEAHGRLYGTLAGGGAANAGVIYSVDPTTGAFAEIRQFADTYDPTPSGLTTLGGHLYGTAGSGGDDGLGSIFRISVGRGTGETVHSFTGTDGGSPSSPLLAVGGLFYGTTSGGGAANAGTLFSFDPVQRSLTTLASFDPSTIGIPVSPLTFVGGALYGTTFSEVAGSTGAIFRFDLATGALSAVATFSPSSGLPAVFLGPQLTLADDGDLYGTAYGGGAAGFGTIFKLDLSTGTLAAVYSFAGGKDGSNPYGGLISQGGLLYGTTTGGLQVKATVFKFDPSTNVKTILHRPSAQLYITSSLTPRYEKLFGTFETAASAGSYGGIFHTDVRTGATVSFDFPDGTSIYPQAPLVLTNGNALWGTAQTDAPNAAGSVFKFVP